MQRQDTLRETIREWLLVIMDKHAVSQRQIGLRSGVSPTTINRALDADGNFVMSTTIISKISAAFGEAPPSALGSGNAAQHRPSFQLGDLEAAPVNILGFPTLPATNLYRARVVSEVLNLDGFRPGDICDFDMDVKPEAGDFVVAQQHLLQTGGQAITVLRIYQPPYLLTRSTDLTVDHRPLYVDNERVVIVGTFVRLLRERADPSRQRKLLGTSWVQPVGSAVS